MKAKLPRNGSFAALNLREEFPYDLRNLSGEQRWDGVAHLVILLSAWPFEKVVVRERLQARSFPDREASTLSGVVVDIVMAVLRDVGNHRRGWA